MQNFRMRFTSKTGRAVALSGLAVLLGAAVLETSVVPAGAVTPPPYSSLVTVQTSAALPVTGSSVTWTATELLT